MENLPLSYSNSCFDMVRVFYATLVLPFIWLLRFARIVSLAFSFWLVFCLGLSEVAYIIGRHYLRRCTFQNIGISWSMWNTFPMLVGSRAFSPYRDRVFDCVCALSANTSTALRDQHQLRPPSTWQ